MTRQTIHAVRLGIIAGLCLIAAARGASASIDISGSALVSAQKIDFDSTSGALDEDFNFNDPRVNLYFKSTISENIALNFTLWASNDWSSANNRGNAGTVVFDDAAELRGAFITIKNVGGSKLTLKAGKVPISYGYEAPNRTANGDSTKNDFLTNSLLDMHGNDEGIALSGSFEASTTPISWEASITNGGAVTDGNPSGAGGQTRSNADLALAARITAKLADNITAQASWYSSDQSKDGDNDALNIGSSFFVTAVQDGTATNKNLVGLVYAGQGQGSAYDRDLWEVSAKYDYGNGYFMGFWGDINADTVTPGASREWKYWGIQGRYNVDENAYVAARWNALDPDYAGAGALGKPNLLSVAAAYKLADNARVTAEWTSFNEDGGGFSNEGTAVGAASTSDGRNADATALTAGISVKF